MRQILIPPAQHGASSHPCQPAHFRSSRMRKSPKRAEDGRGSIVSVYKCANRGIQSARLYDST